MSGVYLAGPLDGLDPEYDARAWYKDAAESLNGLSAVLYCPGNAYLITNNNQGRYVEQYNRMAIDASRVVLVNLTGPGRALGTIREIEFAKSKGKHVVVIGGLHHSLAAHDLEVVPDIQQACKKVEPWLLG